MAIISSGITTLTDLNDAIISGTKPVNPESGTLWIDTSSNPAVLKVYKNGAWSTQDLDLNSLDPNMAQSIRNVVETIGNMSNDNILDVTERKIIKNDLSDIIGKVMGDTETVLPTVAQLETLTKGSFYSARQNALNAGVDKENSIYIDVATQYQNLKTYLESMSPVKPWDSGATNQKKNITVVKTTFRDKWLQYYLATEKLNLTTTQQIKDSQEELDGKISEVSLRDKTEILSGTEIFTDKADDESVVHVEVDGKSVGGGSGKNLIKGDTTRIVTATANGAWQFDTILVQPLTTGKKYIFSADVEILSGSATSVSVLARKSDGSSALSDFMRTTIVDGKIRGDMVANAGIDRLYLYAGTAGYTNGISIRFTNIQVEQADVATPYEPPAPTPDYPIAINSLNNVDVVSSVGKENFIGNSEFLVEATSGLYAQSESVGLIPMTQQELTDTFMNKRVTFSYFVHSVGSRQVNPISNGSRFGMHGSIQWKDSTGQRSNITEYPFANYLDASINNARVVMSTTLTPPNGYDTIASFGFSCQPYARPAIGNNEVWKLGYPKLELGEETPYNPANEYITGESKTANKTNISLPEPLRSVEDVKDRLFRDTDGLWKVERNVGEHVLTGNYAVSLDTAMAETTSFRFTISKRFDSYKDKMIFSHGVYQRGKYNSNGFVGVTTYSGQTEVGGNYMICLPNSIASTIEQFRNWATEQETKGNPLTIIYSLGKDSVTIETLPDDLQQKLNNIQSYKGSNYVYTVLTDKSDILTPNLRATFKSNMWYRLNVLNENIDFGSRNWARNGNFSYTPENSAWKDYYKGTTRTIVDISTEAPPFKNALQISQTTSGVSGIVDAVIWEGASANVLAGKKVSMATWLKYQNITGSELVMQLQVTGKKSDGTFVYDYPKIFAHTGTDLNWKRQTGTVQINMPAGATEIARIVFRLGLSKAGTGTFWTTGIQIQTGNVVGEWNINPQDIESEFEKTEARLILTEKEAGLSVKKGDVVREINVSDEKIKIASDKIDITGAVTFSSFDTNTKNTINDKASKAEAQGYVNNLEIGARNLIVTTTIVTGKYLIETNGTLGVATGHDVTDFIPVIGSQAYTVSALNLSQIRIVYYDINKNYIGGFLWSGAQGTSKIVNTPSNAKFVKWSGDRANGSPVSSWKFEKGSKATDWTPAPEDTDAMIAQAQADATNAKNSAGTANQLLSDLSSDSILAPVEKKSVKKEWDIIVSEKAKIDAEATEYGIVTEKTTYNTHYNTLNTYITPLLSNLNTNSAIVATTFRANFKNYYDARQDLLNAITSKAKSLADKAQGDIDGLEIGGRNYFTKSHTFSQTTANSAFLPRDAETPNGFRVTGNSSGNGQIRLGNVITENGWWTVSFDIKGSQSGAVGMTVDICDLGGTRVLTNNTNTYSRVSVSVKVTNYSSGVYNFVDFGAIGWNYFWVNNIKVEKGNKATEWTPSIEDIDKSISDAQSTADNAKASIADMSSDNKITPVEKVQLKKEWATISAEKPSLDSIATTYGATTEKTNLGNAYSTLNTALNGSGGILTSMTSTSSVTGSTFRNQFDDYYDKKALLMKKINETARSLANNAQGTADTVKGVVSNFDSAIINANPIFLDWSSTLPVGYASMTGSALAKVASGNGMGNAIKYTVPANTNCYLNPTQITTFPFFEYVTIELTFKLESGTVDGAGVLFRYNGTGITDHRIHIKDFVPSPVLNKWYTITKVIRQATTPAGFTGYTIYPMGGFTSLGAITAKTIQFDSLKTRQSTEQEINAYESSIMITDMSMDSKVTPVEKVQLKKEWATINAERTSIDGMASTYGITTERTNMTNAYNTLNTVLNGTGGILTNMTTTSTVVATTFRAQFDDYYDKKAILQRKINETARTLANSAQGTADTANTNATNAKSKTDAWTYSGTTEINGGKIRTNTILANAINATTLSAITANLGTVTAGIVKSGNGMTELNLGTGVLSTKSLGNIVIGDLPTQSQLSTTLESGHISQSSRIDMGYGTYLNDNLTITPAGMKFQEIGQGTGTSHSYDSEVKPSGLRFSYLSNGGFNGSEIKVDTVSGVSIEDDYAMMAYNVGDKNGQSTYHYGAIEHQIYGQASKSVMEFDSNGVWFPEGIQSIKLSANSNLNDVIKTGFYYCPTDQDTKTIANTPMNDAFSLLVERHAGHKQTFTTYKTGSQKTFTRNYYNGSWGSWVQVGSYSHQPAVQEGMVTISVTANTMSSTAVKFKQPFSNTPRILVSANSGANAFRSVSAFNVSSTGFSAGVFRTDSTNTQVWWMAVEDTSYLP